MRIHVIFFILISLYINSYAQIFNRPWTQEGIAGGSGTYSPSFSPHQEGLIYLASDLTQMFKSIDGGESWSTIPFQNLSAVSWGEVNFTADPNILYTIHFNFRKVRFEPVISLNAGAEWQALPHDPTNGQAYFLGANPHHTNQLILASRKELFYSSDAGNSFTKIDSLDIMYVADTYWDETGIFVATREGLLVSRDNGASFEYENLPALEADQGFLSFTCAKEEGRLYIYGITQEKSRINTNTFGRNYHYPSSQHFYSWLEGEEKRFSNLKKTVSFQGDFPFYIRTFPGDKDIIYLAGADADRRPLVLKSTDAGTSWQQILNYRSNENIETGFMGFRGDKEWFWSETAFSFAISPTDPNHAIFTDFSFVHTTKDGGQSWQAAYIHPEDRNPAGQNTPKRKAYRHNGLVNTSIWMHTFLDEDTRMVGMSDFRAAISKDNGMSWYIHPEGINYNTIYQVIKHPEEDIWYAAASGIHDMYQSTYITDDAIQETSSHTGAILMSEDTGATWEVLHDFGMPVVSIAIDPNQPKTMYAGVVNHGKGGVFKTLTLSEGSASGWSRLPSPPGTEGHPYIVNVLEDGNVLCTFSARRIREENFFTESSGVFYSQTGGASWEDRSAPEMKFWTKDIVIDPHDPAQNTWYVAVFTAFGNARDKDFGGVYRTKDRGQSWERIRKDFRVESVAIDPQHSNVMVVTTEDNGLWYTKDLHLEGDTIPFYQVESFPFQHPVRAYFNPYKPEELLVTTFGSGVYKTDLSINKVSPIPLTWRIFPNPSQDFIQIDSKGQRGMLEVFDLQGNLQLRQAISPQGFTLQKTELGGGIYILRMRGERNRSKIQKVIFH